jgi:uncharacterized protein (TIGR02444 family)
MTAGDADAFWNFSLRVYALPGVKEACLRLQDEADLDVNVLLYCLWRGSRGVLLGADELRGRLAALRPWVAEAVVPLRTLRRALRAPALSLPAEPARALGERLLALELDAERTAQRLLVETVPEPDAAIPSDGAVTANLQLYLRLADAAAPEEAVAALAKAAQEAQKNM